MICEKIKEKYNLQ